MILELSGFHPIWFANGLSNGRSWSNAWRNRSRDPLTLNTPAATARKITQRSARSIASARIKVRSRRNRPRGISGAVLAGPLRRGGPTTKVSQRKQRQASPAGVATVRRSRSWGSSGANVACPRNPQERRAKSTMKARYSDFPHGQRYRLTCAICTVTRMTSHTREVVRNQLLIDALGGPIVLKAVVRQVKPHNPAASPVEVQNETLDAIREWVSDELFRIGAPVGKSQRFEAWHHRSEHSLHQISHVYVKHYGDPEKWMFSAWLSLTGKGELLARSLEEKDIDGYRPKAT